MHINHLNLFRKKRETSAEEISPLVLALEKAVEIAGGQTALARSCGVKQSYIYNWLRRNKKVSAQYVLKVEAATNGKVSRHELRPDIYPPPKGSSINGKH